MLYTLLIALAVLGFLTVIVGRHLMIRDTGGEVTMLWMVALRLIPFSELIYMVRHYAQAKTGGIVSIVGLWLMVPYAGTKLWEAQTSFQQRIEERQKKMTSHPSDSNEIEGVDFSEMSAEGGAHIASGRTRHLLEKEKKVQQINTRLTWWHQQLQQRRAALAGADEATLRAFNADAAAYSAFNTIAKEENAELAVLRAKQ